MHSDSPCNSRQTLVMRRSGVGRNEVTVPRGGSSGDSRDKVNPWPGTAPRALCAVVITGFIAVGQKAPEAGEVSDLATSRV
jgi:hypothetical protein